MMTVCQADAGGLLPSEGGTSILIGTTRACGYGWR
jgi:hypothetical protein